MKEHPNISQQEVFTVVNGHPVEEVVTEPNHELFLSMCFVANIILFLKPRLILSSGIIVTHKRASMLFNSTREEKPWEAVIQQTL